MFKKRFLVKPIQKPAIQFFSFSTQQNWLQSRRPITKLSTLYNFIPQTWLSSSCLITIHQFTMLLPTWRAILKLALQNPLLNSSLKFLCVSSHDILLIIFALLTKNLRLAISPLIIQLKKIRIPKQRAVILHFLTLLIQLFKMPALRLRIKGLKYSVKGKLNKVGSVRKKKILATYAHHTTSCIDQPFSQLQYHITTVTGVIGLTLVINYKVNF